MENELMARRRYLSTEISKDKKVNILATKHGDFAALLYTWMIPHTLDTGILDTSDLDEIMMMVIPGRRDKTIDDVRSAIIAMVDLGLILVLSDKIVFPYDSYYKYQSYINSANRRNPNEYNDVKESAFSATKMLEMPQNAASLSPSPSPSVSPSVTPKESTPLPPQGGDGVGDDGKEAMKDEPAKAKGKGKGKPKEPEIPTTPIHQERISLFWEEFPKSPRKNSRAVCLDWLKRNIKTDDQFDNLLDRLDEDKLCEQWNREGGRFIPAPVVWLRKKRHLDEPANTGGVEYYYLENPDGTKWRGRGLTKDEDDFIDQMIEEEKQEKAQHGTHL